jgi:hypothetical protein
MAWRVPCRRSHAACVAAAIAEDLIDEYRRFAYLRYQRIR